MTTVLPTYEPWDITPPPDALPDWWRDPDPRPLARLVEPAPIADLILAGYSPETVTVISNLRTAVARSRSETRATP